MTNLRVLAFSLLIVAIAYANAAPLPFVQSDDFLIVASNPGIRSIAPLRFLFEPYWSGYKFGGIYRPLTILSFSIDWAVWHRWAPGFRLTNLLLHALNGWLVFLLASTMIGTTGAWAAAAVYLVHPVHTEAIVGIVGRAELLAATFFFAAWLMFRRGRPIWAAGFFFLSLMSKESAIMLPAVMLLDRWLGPSPSGRGRREAPGEGPSQVAKLETLTLPSPKARGWFDLIPMIVVAAVYLTLRYSVLGGLGVPSTLQYMHGVMSVAERWMTSGRSFLQYFRLALAPVDVAASYEFNVIHVAHLRDADAWAGLLAVLACIVAAIALAKKRPALSFAILFFFVALLPVSNWIMPISVLVAERFLYTPVFGVALLAGIAWAALPARRVQYLTGGGVLAAAIILCISHNWTWQDDTTFFTNMVRVTPDNLSARLGYGLILQNSGLADEAKEQFEAGLRVDPDSPALLSALAGVVVQTDPKHCERAQPLLERVFKSDPTNSQSLWVQANCYALKGDPEKADASYRQAVEHAPVTDGNLLFSWAGTLERLGKQDEAIELYRRVAALNPDDLQVRQKLATLGAEPAQPAQR